MWNCRDNYIWIFNYFIFGFWFDYNKFGWHYININWLIIWNLNLKYVGFICVFFTVNLDGVGDNDYIIKYDNGLKLTKVGTKTLRITNYGRVFLKDDVYYTITLYHKNNPRSTAKIVIRYTDSGTNNELGFDFRDDQ